MESGTAVKEKSGLDTAKWVASALLVAAAVVGNSFFSEQAFLYRLIGVVALIGAAGFIFSTSSKGVQLLALFKDARAEAKRVVWPSKQETWSTAAIVVVVVLVSALILWGIDYLLGSLISFIIG